MLQPSEMTDTQRLVIMRLGEHGDGSVQPLSTAEDTI